MHFPLIAVRARRSFDQSQQDTYKAIQCCFNLQFVFSPSNIQVEIIQSNNCDSAYWNLVEEADSIGILQVQKAELLPLSVVRSY